MSFLIYEQSGPVVTLTMNQPERRNTLTGNTAIPEFVEACARIDADRGVKAVILTGAGSAFCAGGDVNAMQRFVDPSCEPASILEEYETGIQRLTRSLYNLEVPAIAAVNGPAIGAGCDLACMCDIRIASESATFAESFIKVGIVPGDGGAWLLPRVVGMSKAAEMSFTGEMLTAEDALRCGLVSRVVPPPALLDAAQELAGRIAANPGQTLRLTKKLLRETQNLDLDGALRLSAAYQALAHKTRDHAEAVAAFKEKRKPRFDR